MILLLFNKYYTHAIIVETAETTAASSNIAATLHYILSQALFLCRLWSGFTCRHATFFAFLLYSLFNIIVVVVVLPVNEAYTVVGWRYCCFYNAYLLCSMLLLLMLPLSFCLVHYIYTYMHTYTHGTIHTLQHTPTNSTRTTATCMQ